LNKRFAATALIQDLVVVSRNVAHYLLTGVQWLVRSQNSRCRAPPIFNAASDAFASLPAQALGRTCAAAVHERDDEHIPAAMSIDLTPALNGNFADGRIVADPELKVSGAR
jgi:hypothetical protein